jgi:hypothetical protein
MLVETSIGKLELNIIEQKMHGIHGIKIEKQIS